MQRIAISGLVAAAALLGGAVVPTVAMAQPVAAKPPSVRPITAMAARTAEAARITRAARIAKAERLAGLGWRTDANAAVAADEAASGVPLVSCVFTVDCIAVQGSAALTASASGGSTPAAAATGAVVTAARWNGSSWKAGGAALPAGTKEADLNSVSCKAERSCLIVGDYYTSTSDTAQPHALALEYNGSTVKPTPALPLPKGTTFATLNDVSCATVWYCVAVGEADGNSATFGQDGEVTLIETWTGAKWTLRTVAQAVGESDTQISGVSCATDAFCVLTGETVSVSGTSSNPTITSGVYFGQWNGAKLTAMKPAVVGSSADLVVSGGVSCASAANCGVTGVVLDVSGNTASIGSFTEIWNGHQWQLASTPLPSGTTEAILEGISCYAAHSCEAVGADSTDALSATDPSVDVAAVSYNGTAGTLQTLPAPAAGDSDVFTSVSCMPWGTCVAVGDTGKDTATSPATMTGTWSGKAWELHAGF